MQDKTPNEKEFQGLRLSLDLGNPISIRIEQFEQVFKGMLTGAETGRYLIVRTAIPREFESAILPGLTFQVIYQSEGQEFGFFTKVIDILDQPFRLIFLEYPNDVFCIDNRGSSRSSCYIPSSVLMDSNTVKGVITDISTRGCRFLITLPDHIEARQLLPIDSIVLQFPVIGLKGVRTFRGRVRNASVDREKIAMGVEFENLEPQVLQSIAEYVESAEDGML